MKATTIEELLAPFYVPVFREGVPMLVHRGAVDRQESNVSMTGERRDGDPAIQEQAVSTKDGGAP